MNIQLTQSSYGKGGVRVSKIIRHADRHELIEMTVTVECEGDFTHAHVTGDNSAVLPTDTQKNTIYILAKQHPLDSIESFALDLSEHFIKNNPHFETVTVTIHQDLWQPIPVSDAPHPYSFKRAASEQWTTQVERTQDDLYVVSGIEECMIAKTTKSGFSDFKKDDYTTLKNTADRMLATSLTASWLYDDGEIDFAKARKTVQNALLTTFAEHDSLSVQHTLYAMGKAALEQEEQIISVDIEMPNKHHLLVNLTSFDLENNNDIFHVIDEPYGIIQGYMTREEEEEI